ncbi:MAG: NapC/NirT family cytochrome c [Alphaproteobacteria bacterium]|nr:NapC/NirT family cytochrome c [Alphaproteobacteria bacterium]
MKRLSRLWRALLKVVYAYPVAGLSAVFVSGIVFWGGFNWSLELTNTESFCISCHVMEEYVYKEYRKTIHFSNRTGVRATCPDCHVPKEWIYKVVRKVGATNELFHWFSGSIDTPEDFKAKRLELAGYVWASMAATDSRECRNCHGIGFMSPEVQTARARAMHELGEKWGSTCIDCHKGIVHSLPQGFDEEAMMDELHDRMEQEKVDCRLCHEDMTGPPPGEGWD